MLLIEVFVHQGKSLGATEKEVIDWYNTIPRTFHCTFDGTHGTEEEFTKEITPGYKIHVCPQCQQYKGVVPCIENLCEFEER